MNSIETFKGCFSDPNEVITTEAPGAEPVTTTLAPPTNGGNVINDFNCAGQGMLSQIANVASDVNISCFGSSCGVQCVDSSKSPNVSGVFCQTSGKAKKQGWKNGNKVKIYVHFFASANFVSAIFTCFFRNSVPEHQSHVVPYQSTHHQPVVSVE